MAVGHERAHTERLGQGEGLLVVGCGQRNFRTITMGGYLSEEAQGDFAKHMGYAPTVDNVTLEPALASRVMFEPEVQYAFILQDQDYLAKADAGLQEWWNKVFKG